MGKHPIFDKLQFDEIAETTHADFRQKEGLKCLFLWGNQCPNCDFAKKSLLENIETLKPISIQWAQCNVYDHMEVAKAYGLHGIPAFMFFKNSKLLGKVSPYPGFEPFLEVLHKVTQNGY